MKNLTKPLLILICISVLMLNAAHGQTNISVFNTPVNLHSPLVIGEYATGYPTSIGASHLRNCSAIYLNPSELNSIYNAVRNSLVQASQPIGTPVFSGFFTTEYDADSLTVLKNKTHGLCFGFHSGTSLMLYYYEKNTAGNYDRIDKLTTRINAIDDNLFMSLHYSYFEVGAFPDKSTIFRFVCDSIVTVGGNDNSNLSELLSQDNKRQTGLYSAGMAQLEILQDCNGPNTGATNCGNPCLILPNSECAYVADINGFFIYTCRTSGQGTCASGSIERRAKEENITLGVPIRYKRMRDFRDKFMSTYCEGRKYTGFYYTFSKYAKMSIPMLWKYASLFPELYDAMDILSDAGSNKIIVTPALKEKVIAILHDHRDVGDEYFQSILKEVEADMETYEGLRRNDLVALLTPYGNCSSIRKALPETGQSTSCFVSVFDNTGRDEIIVNYSVPGNSIRFELYNATAGLVYSMINAPSKQKQGISTSGLAPGVYIYRIRSDSGYEKMGKVAIIK